MGRVLIIDDDQSLSDMLTSMIQRIGHEAKPVFTLEDGLREAQHASYDVVFLDVGMPDGSGLDIISKLKQSPSAPEIIIITAMGHPDGAEYAIINGAWDYIEKPSSITMMTLPLIRALQYREAKASTKPLLHLNREGIIGEGTLMKSCLGQIAEASASHASVLLTGETGTGKELFAWAIHNNSSRSGRNFVVVDCAALSDTLVESMLFGYEKGAYTGADKARDGLIKQADGGTLFLDEIGELPFSIQKSFLRVLQEHRFRPLGGKSEIDSNFRLVAATNRNLEQMCQDGLFRSDLLFRIRSLSIDLPPLRSRTEDIRDIAMFHMTRLCDRYRMELKGFSPEFLEALISYDWPGNVRELVNTMERVLASSPGEPVLFPKHLPNHIRVKIARASIRKKSSPEPVIAEPSDRLPTLSEMRERSLAGIEKEYLAKLMSLSGEDMKNACQISGLSRSRLYELLKKYQIKI